ncbi:50S ribosomal protein L33 [Poseidonibacter lekithochrous]|jgi:large subunit ribosomal protein L33|uniref:50S ribosomal protein L33 n=1 Tax=Poseidonibacter TaxID=2321187 RepID=UPI001C094A99|nr:MULTISPECIES: 50S ribosomal protein L33 [Poseidonibacter]MBU3015443.1 50S ribosomal protein L33 [Poseidonibacter lekithochrous]MDO6828742.1 50S ribosomal protein L33 [Poseidonibacter sp. 1_MG-2023]
MATGSRIKIGLKCQECGDINYTTMKNPKTHTEKFETKKYSPRLKKHTLHKEVKLKS